MGNWAWRRSSGEKDSRVTAPKLDPLSAEYDGTLHGGYFDAIEAALENSNTRNIALSGPYGSGKSSILKQVAKRYGDQVVEISLSSLGGLVADQDTNQLQKEIVKQLLYREPPHNMKESRYPRAATPRTWVDLSKAAVAGGVALAAALALRIPQRWEPWKVDAPLPAVGAYVAWWILLSAAALAVVWAAHSRPALRELSAGPAKISLSEPSRTYFDDYLDEIVYFFQRSNADIVILEDIDRFGNAEVFDNLRALNTLLNNAKQLRRRPIRFVYAFRDSVFAGPSRARLEPSARTKFFDVIVPVVPFMTHINARDLVSKVMSTDTTTITRELVEVVAPRLTDMRLLKNIRNEFLIYRDQLVDVEASVPGLSDDALFALIVYKNLEISDFESSRRRGATTTGCTARGAASLTRTSPDLTRHDVHWRRRYLGAPGRKLGRVKREKRLQASYRSSPPQPTGPQI